MIVLLPTTSIQTISIMPRVTDFLYESDYSSRAILDGGSVESISCTSNIFNIYNDVNLSIRKDGDGTSETILDVAVTLNGNFIDLSFSCTILEEGSTYFLEATSNGNLIYRDKIFSTTQTDYTVKHIISQNLYDPYSPTDDNTYIV